MWKKYEIEVYEALKLAYPECEIEFNDSILGIYSKAERQIDFSIRGAIAGKRILGIVDCKFYNKNVDVKGVESFIGMSQDVNANFGFLITNNGYSQASKNRIKFSNIKLDILEFNEFGKIDIPVDYFFNQNIKGLQLSKYEFIKRNKHNTAYFDSEKSDYFNRIICFKEGYAETEYYAYKKLLENTIKAFRDFEQLDLINIFIPANKDDGNKYLYSCEIKRHIIQDFLKISIDFLRDDIFNWREDFLKNLNKDTVYSFARQFVMEEPYQNYNDIICKK